MSDTVDIVNIALANIGEGPIAALTDNSKTARAANLIFVPERDFVLRDFPWPFAMRYVELGWVGGDDEEAVNHDWQYSYRFPSSALVVRRLVREGGERDHEVEPAPFEIGSDATGRLIFTDEPPEDPTPVAQITARIEDASQFDPIFVSALAWRLAGKLAMPLTRVEKTAGLCFQMYQLEIQKAQATAANEQQRKAPKDAAWVTGR